MRAEVIKAEGTPGQKRTSEPWNGEGRAGRAAEIGTRRGQERMEPLKPDRAERLGKNKILAIEHPWLDDHLFIHSLIHFTHSLNKYLFIDFLSSGALRSLDKKSRAQGGEMIYCRSPRSYWQVWDRAQVPALLTIPNHCTY